MLREVVACTSLAVVAACLVFVAAQPDSLEHDQVVASQRYSRCQPQARPHASRPFLFQSPIQVAHVTAALPCSLSCTLALTLRLRRRFRCRLRPGVLSPQETRAQQICWTRHAPLLCLPTEAQVSSRVSTAHDTSGKAAIQGTGCPDGADAA